LPFTCCGSIWGVISVGCDSSKLILEQARVSNFSVCLMLKNKIDNHNWTFTYVYGHVDNSLKVQFLDELSQIRKFSYEVWLICGDF
jgi:hypothetical protein